MNDIHIAESAFETSALPPQFIAGDTPALVTADQRFNALVAWPQYTPLQLDATNGYEPWVAGNQVAAITPFDIAIGEQRKVLILGVMANIDAVLWPSGATENQVEAGLTGMIRARKLLYSDQRTGNEVLGMPAGPQQLEISPASGALTASAEDVAMDSVQLSALNPNGTVTYSLHSGTLPAGTTVSAAGLYAGTPTTVGDYTFAVKGVDETGRIGIVNYTHEITA